jgi:hypothetical protein
LAEAAGVDAEFLNALTLAWFSQYGKPPFPTRVGTVTIRDKFTINGFRTPHLVAHEIRSDCTIPAAAMLIRNPKNSGSAIASNIVIHPNGKREFMAGADRQCALCGETISWNQSFSIENGKEFHVAPRKCWAEHLETKDHKEGDSVEHRYEIESE